MYDDNSEVMCLPSMMKALDMSSDNGGDWREGQKNKGGKKRSVLI